MMPVYYTDDGGTYDNYFTQLTVGDADVTNVNGYFYVNNLDMYFN